ncbi:MAG: alpha/beta hydrolase [Pseudomonadota bacterium]
MKRYLLDTPYGQIHYAVEGAGDPVILLHMTARSRDEYAEVIPMLAKKYRVIAMDTLGYGDSDKPSKQLSIEDYAKTVVMIMDEVGVKKSNVIGRHTGAFIAMEVAAAYPERLDKLILSEPHYHDERMRKGEEVQAFFRTWVAFWKEWLRGGTKDDGSHFIEAWETIREHAPSMPPSLINRIILEHLKAGDSSTNAYYAVFSYPMEKRIPLIQCPTLLMWGTKDVITFDLGGPMEKTNEIIKRKKVVYIEGGTFVLPNMMPEKFAQPILDFFENPGV